MAKASEFLIQDVGTGRGAGDPCVLDDTQVPVACVFSNRPGTKHSKHVLTFCGRVASSFPVDADKRVATPLC